MKKEQFLTIYQRHAIPNPVLLNNTKNTINGICEQREIFKVNVNDFCSAYPLFRNTKLNTVYDDFYLKKK